MLYVLLLVVAVSCWKYSRLVEIDSPSDSPGEDVLILVDTQEIISDGKMLPNCTDLEFTSTDDVNIKYEFYLESLCNSPTTFFWITLDVPIGVSYVYLFYGADEFDDEGPSVEFTGEFVAPYYNDVCPSGWREVTEMNDNYIRVGPVYGSFGGSYTHDHYDSGFTTLYTGNVYVEIVDEDYELPYMWVATALHEHRFHSYSNSVDNLPPYVSINFCSAPEPVFSEDHVGIFVTYADAPGDYTDLFIHGGRLMCKNCDTNTTAVGSEGGFDSHDHLLFVTMDGACPEEDTSCYVFTKTGSSRDGCLNDHWHENVDVPCTSYTGMPESFTPYFAQYTAALEIQSFENLILSADGLPPKGWSEMVGYDGNLLRFPNDAGEIGDFNGENYHDHSYDVIHTNPTLRYANLKNPGIARDVASWIHVHDISSTTFNNSIVPSYFEIPLFMRKPSVPTFVMDENWLCFGISWNDSEVCNGHGECVGPNKCNCSEEYVGRDCASWGCYGVEYYSPLVCGAHGECLLTTECLCDEGYYGLHSWWNDCTHWNCSGDDPQTGVACTGHGQCLETQNCTCDVDYYDDKCDNWFCDGISRWDDLTVCFGKGSCVSPDNCTCDLGYYGEECELWNCSNIPKDDWRVCSEGRGVCTKPDTCNCTLKYYGDNCEEFDCWNLPYDHVDVCNGHGQCIDIDDCECDHGYFDSQCDNWDCYDYNKDVPEVCSEHGICQLWDDCDCTDPFFGRECELWNCYGISWVDSKVCNGRGDCPTPESCVCIQDTCPEDLGGEPQRTDCIYGKECAEVITFGHWIKDTKIVIDWLYLDVLDDELLQEYDEKKNIAFFLCSDLLGEDESLSFLGPGGKDEKSCFFYIVDGMASALHIRLQKEKKETIYKGKSLIFRPLSIDGRTENVEVVVAREWEDKLIMSPASEAAAWSLFGIFFLVVIIAIIVLAVVIYLLIKNKNKPKGEQEDFVELKNQQDIPKQPEKEPEKVNVDEVKVEEKEEIKREEKIEEEPEELEPAKEESEEEEEEKKEEEKKEEKKDAKEDTDSNEESDEMSDISD